MSELGRIILTVLVRRAQQEPPQRPYAQKAEQRITPWRRTYEQAWREHWGRGHCLSGLFGLSGLFRINWTDQINQINEIDQFQASYLFLGEPQ